MKEWKTRKKIKKNKLKSLKVAKSKDDDPGVCDGVNVVVCYCRNAPSPVATSSLEIASQNGKHQGIQMKIIVIVW